MHTTHTYTMDTIHHSFSYVGNRAPYTIGLHTGNPVPFLYTPTSLLPEHSVLTDVQQATGRNGQQWITCRSGGQGTRPQILMGNNVVHSNSTDNSATIGLGTQHPNGLYRCLSAQSQRGYFSLFLRNSGKYIICYLHRCQTQQHVRYAYVYISKVYKAKLKSVSLAVLVQLHDVPSFSHSINTHCKCTGHLSVDNCITRWQQSGEIYCRV